MDKLYKILGSKVDELLSHECKTISKDVLHLPGGNFVDRVLSSSDRSINVLKNIETLFKNGRLGGTGYLSILPVDQGVEHTAGSAFAPNPIYFDGENILKLALEGGCNAVASTFGILGSVARKYAHKIPFIVKLNHNELLSYPNTYDQVFFGKVREAWNMGAVAVGATIYFGSPESRRQIVEVAQAFNEAHKLGMATVLWCYTRNSAFKRSKDHHTAADITGQANYLGVTIEADIIKQKMATHAEGFIDLNYSKTDLRVYSELTTDHPIDLVRYQVANCFMGRSGLINSGGESVGKNDLHEILKAAVINKRGGGMGLIAGRKVFQKDFHEGVNILHSIQDVYLDQRITIA